MRRFVVAGALALALAQGAAAETGRTGKPSVSAEQLAEAQSTFIFALAEGVAPRDVRGVAERAVRNGGGRMKHVYVAGFKGFAAQMNIRAAEQLVAQFPEIVSFERDQIATTLQTAGTTNTTVAPWGTLRVNGQTCGLPYSRVWVMDTGIDLDHPDLSIADQALHFTAYRPNANDVQGHGTHVAGTIGARDRGTSAKGVAPRVPLVPVKVLADNGSGSYSAIMAGIDHIVAQKDAACSAGSVWCNKPEAWVVNMSLGGGFSQILNDAVIAAAAKGIRFAIAAGNSARDARNFSPASANHANIFTVAASTSGGFFASFSNFGRPPVDYIAPGANIDSTYIDADGYASLSGTSMAAPHVAGILTISPSLQSNGTGVSAPLTVNGLSYTSGTITYKRVSYPLAYYRGDPPQTVSSEADCTYKQPLMSVTTN